MGCDSQFDDLYPTAYERALERQLNELRKSAPYGTEWDRLRKEAKEIVDQQVRADGCREAYYTYFFASSGTANVCLQCGALTPDSYRDIHINWHYPEGKGKHALDRTNH